MKLHIRSVPALALLLLTTTAAPLAALAPPRPSSARVVTQDELQSSRQSNLYDFVRTYRPQWLRTRGTIGVSTQPVVVFLDGQRVGGSEQLKGISTEITASMQYLDWREAGTRWGPGLNSGAIMVATGPLPEPLLDRDALDVGVEE